MKTMSLPQGIVRKEIVRLVPASVIEDIACFVFYDKHPRDNNDIDITICTRAGEVKEFYQRNLLTSAHLDNSSSPTDIRILRNSKAELFYLVLAGEELIILSRRENLQVHKKVYNVEKYEVEDAICRGQYYLKVLCKDDAVPLVIDENFEILSDKSQLHRTVHADDSLPIITQLMTKLTEAKYSVKCNEKTLKDLSNLRQSAAFSINQKQELNLNSSDFQTDPNEITGALKLESKVPWVKTCNGKIAIVLNATNHTTLIVEDVHILLHSPTTSSLVYSTKLFENTLSSPYWMEKNTQKLTSHGEMVIVGIVDLKELKYSVSSKIEFNGVVCYKVDGKEHLLPFDDVIISPMETMEEQFGVLNNGQIDDHRTLLALLSTSECTELLLRHIKNDKEPDVSILDMFCSHLEMERVPNADNIVVHRKSPYHALNGVMVVTKNACEITTSNIYSVFVYTRTPSQVLALIHYIHDAVPARLIVTTQNYAMRAKSERLSQYNEDIPEIREPSVNITNYATSVLNRTAMILDYLDKSVIKMNENKNPALRNKVGKEIDLFAGGKKDYLEFRNKMLDQGAKGFQDFSNCDISSEDNVESMILD